jgi:chromosome segregation ATPase
MEQKEIATTETIKIEEDYSVTVTHKENLLSFFRNGANLDGLYNVVETKARALVADVTTKEGVSQIKSTARQIASIKKRVDDLGKDIVAELKDLPKQIDANRKKWREDMEALQEEIRKPVTEIENRQDEIEEIKATHGKLALSGSEEIKAAIVNLDKIELTGDKWKESLEDATAAVTAEKDALEVMLNAAIKKEAEARELEELRKKQEEAERIIREQKIREEAERKAREQAESQAAAERERHRQEMERAERERQEAERKAAEAEKAAKEAMEREAEARRNQATASVDFPVFQGADATANNGAQTATPGKRPSRWTDEQKKVNSAILARFAEIIRASLPKHIAGHSDQGYELAANEAAKEIIKAIACGKIENINVRY